MRSITDIEVEYILQDIERKGVITEDIKYNILDHVCCILETSLKPEENFYKKYEETIVLFYKEELLEIEQETQELLTFKYYYAMKKTLKISSIVSVSLTILGIVFKLMHWQGAGILFLLGLVFFSLIYMPLIVVLKFKDDKTSSNRLIMIVGMLSASISTLGSLFKIMHWPGANILMLSGLIIFTLLFIPVYFIVKYREPSTRFNSIINTTLMLGGACVLFALTNIHGKSNETIKQEDSVIEKTTKKKRILLNCIKLLNKKKRTKLVLFFIVIFIF